MQLAQVAAMFSAELSEEEAIEKAFHLVCASQDFLEGFECARRNGVMVFAGMGKDPKEWPETSWFPTSAAGKRGAHIGYFQHSKVNPTEPWIVQEGEEDQLRIKQEFQVRSGAGFKQATVREALVQLGFRHGANTWAKILIDLRNFGDWCRCQNPRLPIARMLTEIENFAASKNKLHFYKWPRARHFLEIVKSDKWGLAAYRGAIVKRRSAPKRSRSRKE